MGGRGGVSHAGAGASAGPHLMAAKAFLDNAYGKKHSEKILEIIAKAPAGIREMWEKFGGMFRAGRMDPHSDQAYYSPYEHKVYLGIEDVAAGDVIHTPYSTVFHEYGHMTDYLIGTALGGGGYGAYSEFYEGGLLGDTAKSELKSLLSRMKRMYPEATTKQAAAQHLIDEIKGKYSMRDRSDISDMLEGAGIGVSYPLGSGHGASYWGNRDNGLEIFAEMTAAEASAPGSLRAIKEYFPKTYSVYKDMIDEWRKMK